MFGDMFNKKMMGQMQEQMENIKQKLATISVNGEAENGALKVEANGNRLLNTITIDDDFFKDASKEEIEELIVIAANRALEQAERIEKSEMGSAAMGMIPGLG